MRKNSTPFFCFSGKHSSESICWFPGILMLSIPVALEFEVSSCAVLNYVFGARCKMALTSY